MLVVVMLAACAAVPDGDPDADSDDADAEHDEAIAEAREIAAKPPDPARETPLAKYLRERREFLVAVDRDQPEGRDLRRLLRISAKECKRGVGAAEAELDDGDFGQAMHGLPANCFDRYAKEAARRYDVHYHLMGCVIDDHSGAFASCYNTVMDRAIDQAHGPGVLDELRKEICAREKAL